MTLALLVGAALAQDLPAVEARWRRGVAWLEVEAPAGEHLNADGPFEADLSVGGRAVSLSGSGAVLAGGLPLAGGATDAISGFLQVPLCVDGGDACRIASVAVSGRLQGSARASLLVLPSEAAEEPPGPLPLAAAAPAHRDDPGAAFAEAKALNQPVLLDFGAVWCPPCNLLNAELLHDPADAAALAGVIVVSIDSDQPASWALKDRYRVGGYPTLILVRPDGAELDRLVGYPGEAQTKAWLERARGGAPRLAWPDPGALSPDEAAAVAWDLVRRDQKADAKPYIAAAAGSDTASFHLARIAIEPTAADVLWLARSGSDPLEWMWSAQEVEDPAARAALQRAIDARLPSATPLEAADLLWVSAEIAPEAQKPTLYAAAAGAMRAALSGDPERDRGLWTFQADIFERAGQPDAALAVLAAAAERYPEEFTYHHAQAGMLLRQERPAEAVEAARRAYARSYGDNRLRAAKSLAEALVAAGDRAAARDVLLQALAEAPRPDPSLQVRTHRYIKQLEEALDRLPSAEAQVGR